MSDQPIEYYELVLRRIEPPKEGEFQITTAAVWSCTICHEVIDGMDGPCRGTLCKTCGDKIKTGNARLVAL